MTPERIMEFCRIAVELIDSEIGDALAAEAAGDPTVQATRRNRARAVAHYLAARFLEEPASRP